MRPVLFSVALCASAGIVSAQSPATAVQLESGNALGGYWSFVNQAATADALFRDSAGQVRLTVRCTRATRRVSIHVPSPAATGAVTVSTSSGIRNLAGRFDQPSSQAIADLPAADALFDAIAFSRGRFAVSLPGHAPVVVPAGPEVGRVVEDCRS